MKKILILLLFMFISVLSTNAEGILNDYQVYQVFNKKVSEFNSYLEDAIGNNSIVKKLKDTNYAYYFAYNDEHYYIRLYPANENTNVFIVSDSEYDKTDNELTKLLKKLDLKYEEYSDKDAIREYKHDFVEYARTGALDGLFVLPDYIKPLKTGMGKLNDKISKKSKKDSTIPYSNDTDPINLDCVNTENHTNSDAKIDITIKEYRLKNKENKYVHAYEYFIKNNDKTSITIDKVTSERLAGMKDITTNTFVDLDKVDMLDTVGTFPPVLIMSCGTSALLSVPNWVRLAKVTKESLRFAHQLPENYKLNGNDSMRILVMKFKDDPKPLNFVATREGKTYRFSY